MTKTELIAMYETLCHHKYLIRKELETVLDGWQEFARVGLLDEATSIYWLQHPEMKRMESRKMVTTYADSFRKDTPLCQTGNE